MYLDVARERNEASFDHALASSVPFEVFKPWKDWEPSQISHHASRCCELVREWVGNMDFSALNGGKLQAGPRWIRQRFEWGPGTYPIHWCEVPNKSKLDC